MDTLELMESKLIFTLGPKQDSRSGFEILEEVSGYYQGIRNEICEEIDLIFQIYGGDDAEHEQDVIEGGMEFKECTKAEAKKFLKSDQSAQQYFNI